MKIIFKYSYRIIKLHKKESKKMLDVEFNITVMISRGSQEDKVGKPQT